MTYRRLLAVLLLVLTFMGVAVARPADVSACSMSRDAVAVLQADPSTPLRAFAQDDATKAVIVGEVVDERVEDAGFPYTSDVQVVAVLHGDPPPVVTLTDLGMPLECFSGPRMQVGERLLLFLTDEDPFGTVDPERVDWHVIAVGQAVYVLDGGHAALRGAFVEAPEGNPVGSAEAFLGQVGELLGSDEDQVDRAIAYANGDLAPLQAVPPVDSGPNPVAVGGSVAITVIAVSILGGWYLRGRRRRRG